MADLDADLRDLFSAPPEEFTARRGELITRARKRGDTDAAAQLGKARKPTVAAWLVNALVIEQSDAIGRLTDLGEQLRAAQDSLDAAGLRELTGERRALVDELTATALRRAQRNDPPAALRDEVRSTFEAALADPEIAAQLGRLQRAQQWSGFGFSAGGTPDLTLVRGGKDAAKRTPSSGKQAGRAAETAAKAETAAPKQTAAQRRARERAVTAARKAFEAADAEYARARDEEKSLDQDVRALIKRVAKVQRELDRAREQLEAARKSATAARADRLQKRSALDRAEHEATH